MTEHQPTPSYPFDPVMVRKFLTGMLVNPAITWYDDAPTAPDKNRVDVLNSPENESLPDKVMKFEFAGLRPFCVKDTAIAVDAVKFLTVKKRVTVGKLICVTCPSAICDAVT